jgi:aspartate aminotransferase
MRDQHGVAVERDVTVLGANGGRRLSVMAETMHGSEVLAIAADIRRLMAGGTPVCNLTVGDFSPTQFRIPEMLETAIAGALARGETNYPPSDGLPVLKEAIQGYYKRWLGLEYPLDSILVMGGSRPGIFCTYATLVDPDDIIVYPVPSWNNNHYSHITRGVGRPVVCREEDAFLPTRDLLSGPVRTARLLALNSPLNPTGTAFTAETLTAICDLVLEENTRRKRAGTRPLFMLYDQVYWILTFGSTQHVNPVSLRPEMREYTIFVDGISKAFAATGIRVGWTVAPEDITERMSGYLGHVGAWAPRAEQVATAALLNADDEVARFTADMKSRVQQRLQVLYDGLVQLRAKGLPVNTIAPMGAIYLSMQLSAIGKRTRSGEVLKTNEDLRQFLLKEAHLAAVPFQAFGSHENTGWFRLSVGAVSVEQLSAALDRLAKVLPTLM